MNSRSRRAGFVSGLLSLCLLALSGPAPLGSAKAADSSGALPVALFSSAVSGQTQALLLGAWQAGRWQSGAVAGTRLERLAGGRSWRAETLDAPGTAAPERRLLSGPARTGEDPCPETVFLPVTRAPVSQGALLLTRPGQRTRPRPVEVLPTGTPVYQAMMRAELQRRGLKSPVVRLTAVIRTDLDGNGTQEVLLAASHFRRSAGVFSPPPSAEAGDYSVVLLRWVRDGEAHTTTLAGDVYTKTPTQSALEAGTSHVPTQYGLAGVADLNTDGRMEVVLQDAYYEGAGASVLEWSPERGVQERLSEGCGA